MPKKTKKAIVAEAHKLNYPVSQAVKGPAGYFLAPRGITSKGAKEAYANYRSHGMDKADAAKRAWGAQKNISMAHSNAITHRKHR